MLLRERPQLAVVLVQEGVKGVINLIQLQPRIPPSEIKRKIEEAFRRSAQVDAVYQALAHRYPHSRSRGRLGFRAEVGGSARGMDAPR